MQIEINEILVKLSQKTIAAYIEHLAYTSKKIEWLLVNDPKSKNENEMIQIVLESLRNDYSIAVEKMVGEIYDSLIEAVKFENQSETDFFELIENATSSIK